MRSPRRPIARSDRAPRTLHRSSSRGSSRSRLLRRAGTRREDGQELPASIEEGLILREHLLFTLRIERQQAQVNRSEGRRAADRQARSGHQKLLLVRVVVDDAVDHPAKAKEIDELRCQVPCAEYRDTLAVSPPAAKEVSHPFPDLSMTCAEFPTGGKLCAQAACVGPLLDRWSIAHHGDERILQRIRI